ncbi:MAG: uridine kinase [Lachnospiraceae bacterium]|nr:uridine kinase [Lachnospiraceae bacterium]
MQTTFDTIISEITYKIEELVSRKPYVLVAIDGRCASGKTTLAAALADRLNAASAVVLNTVPTSHTSSPDTSAPLRCKIIHMDHFFLRPEQRTPARLAEPGGNVDYERFLAEVLLPLSKQEAFAYRPFDCKTFELKDAIPVNPVPVTIVEGSYACHPLLREYYNLKVFLTVDKDEQMRRILCRNGSEAAATFRDKWIPLEEKYFSACNVEVCCDMTFTNA